MPGAYSEDLRSRVIEAATNGGSIRSAARRFKVSASSAIKWMQQFRETVRTVGAIRDDELDPAFRNRLLDAFKDFR